ncbi:MAG: hypothetical protein WAV13_03965 [Thermodesulfovibrionales bacterium]
MDEAAEKSTTLDAVGAVLGIVKAVRDTGGQPVVPAWLIPIAVIVIATLYYFLRRIDLVELLKRWHEATKQEPPWDPEKGTGPLSPPMDIPEGGMSVPGPGDRWDRNET